MSFLNKLVISIIIFNMMCLPALAVLDIDTSVDYDIRRKYNPNKIENDLLPPLPDKLKNDIKLQSKEDFTKPYSQSIQKQSQITQEVKQATKTVQVKKTWGQNIRLKKGTKFTVRLASGISDKMPAGSKIYFKLPKPIKTKYFYLPADTRFVGIIVDSHTPQLSSNGGLLVIKIEQAIINGNTQEINAKITKANYKKVFFNNIKGKHKYWNNLCNSIKPGKKFYDKTWKTTKKLANDSVTLIFSPFTLVTGVLVLGVNTLTSPIFAMFSKGGSISFPAESAFEIKLLEDTTLYN